jgi:predicted enzyme related to lactoylglutathione lyase
MVLLPYGCHSHGVDYGKKGNQVPQSVWLLSFERREGRPMAKLLGPDFINLQVRDLSTSRAFYTEVLGLTEDPHFSAPGVVLFDSSAIPFALSEPRVNLDEAPHPGWGVVLWIDCDQVNELHAKMEAAGATIIQPPYDGPFGRAFVFADPDGYRITANENPWDRFPLGGRHQR